jgi:menaquinone-specific isochorismate synthase
LDGPQQKGLSSFVLVPFDPEEPATVIEPLILLRVPNLEASLERGNRSTQDLDPKNHELWQAVFNNALDLQGDQPPQGSLVGDAVDEYDQRKEWSRLFQSAKELLNENFVQKIVLSQEIVAPTTHSFTPVRALERLQRSHPNAHLYLFGDRLGASPELILSKVGTALRSTPLAGTRRKEDVNELLTSSKDRVEHGFVVEHILEQLLELNCTVELAESDLIDLGDLVHIRSRIHATASNPTITIFDLIGALAPTPAIAGTPTRRAMEAIRRIEGPVRGSYGGVIGFVEPGGDGEFYLGIRGLEVRGPQVHLRAGVGIVADSNETAEYHELRSKLETTFNPLRQATSPR